MPLILLGAFFVSLSPVLVELSSSPPATIGFVRTLVGGLIMLALSLRHLEDPGLRQIVIRITPVMALGGLAFGGDLFFWHQSIELIGGGVATVLANTQVFHVLVLSWWFLGERVRPAQACWGLLALGAVSLLSAGTVRATYLSGRSFEEIVQGVGFGVATGMCYAVYLVAVRMIQIRRVLPARVTHAFVSLWTAFFLLGFDLAGERGVVGLPAAGPGEWLVLGALGVVVHAAGWFLITTGLPTVPGGVASILLLLQPGLATVWGALFFDQHLEWAQLIGVALLFVAIAGGGLSQRSVTPSEQSSK